MRDAARAPFMAITGRLEGVVPWLYLDVKGLVTIAHGVLVDSEGAVLALPLRHHDGSLADNLAKLSELATVRFHGALSKQGGLAFGRVTELRLDAAGLESVTATTLATKVAGLRASFPDWDNWPACAQLAVLLHAWAVGVGGTTATSGTRADFPRFAALLRAGNFAGAIAEARIDDRGNPGVTPRNTAVATLLRYAADDTAHPDYVPDVASILAGTGPATSPSWDVVHPDVPLDR